MCSNTQTRYYTAHIFSLAALEALEALQFLVIIALVLTTQIDLLSLIDEVLRTKL